MSASRSGSTADGSSWIVKQVGSSLSKSRQCETASTSIIRNHRTIDGALCTNLPVTCGQYMLIDARMRWAFGPVPKSRTSSPSHVRGVNRQNSTKRTQTTGTHTIARLSFFAQKFRPAAKRAPLGRTAWFSSSWDRLALGRRGQACV